MDLRTGALLAQPANGSGGAFAPIFPIGFYTLFDSYLATNLSIPATLASLGSVFINIKSRLTLIGIVRSFNMVLSLSHDLRHLVKLSS